MRQLVFLILLITCNSFGGIFIPDFEESEPYVIVEGRMNFSIDPYWMADGSDEVALFIGDVCIGSTNSVHQDFESHYDLLKVNISYGLPIDLLIAKAYNSMTGTIWNADIMGIDFYNNYYGRDFHIDIRANKDTGQIPEPSSLALLCLGFLGIKKWR